MSLKYEPTSRFKPQPSAVVELDDGNFEAVVSKVIAISKVTSMSKVVSMSKVMSTGKVIFSSNKKPQ